MKPGTSLAFLLGVPRSGTTLLSMLLNQHPKIHCPPEPWLLLGMDAIGQVPMKHPADPPLVASALSQFLAGRRARVLHRAAEALYQQVLDESGKAVFIDKTPRYYHCLDLVQGFLPESRVIWLLRNPLDVAASYQKSWKVSLPQLIIDRVDSPFLFDFVLGIRRLLEFGRHNPVLRVHYEDLVCATGREIKRIFEYLGLAPVEVSPRLHRQIPEFANSSFGDRKIFGNPYVHQDSVDGYRSFFSPGELEVLLASLGERCFEELGYGACFREVCARLQLRPRPEESSEVFEAVQAFAERRKAECEKPTSLGWLEARLKQLAQQVEGLEHERRELRPRLAKSQVRARDLKREVGRLKAQNQALSERILELENPSLSERLRSDCRLLFNIFQHRSRAVLWRAAVGREPPKAPKITLVTPVRNGAEWIESTLRSVLSQDYPELEYIVVDGGSSDATLEIIQRVQEDPSLANRISRIISEKDQGMYDAIAKGFALATGEIFGYLNADDLLEAGALERVGRFFAANPQVSLIYHEDTVLVDGWKFPNVRQPGGICTADLLNQHILFQDGVFFRRSAYEAVGGVRRDLRLAGDYDLWLRLSGHCRFVRRPGHVSCFRIRPGQLSLDLQAYYREVEIARRDFLAGSTVFRRGLWKAQAVIPWLRKRLKAFFVERDRLFFPIDFANLPPPSGELQGTEYGPALSPIDGKPAERLLFSLPDTRFGESDIHHIYLDSRHGIAITHPPISMERLDALYRKHYSSPPTSIREPLSTSPYRLFNQKRIWEKALLRIPSERIDWKWRARMGFEPWNDRTLCELRSMLRLAGMAVDQPLRCLDAGCFEGALLDQMREATPWLASGLEPNRTAFARCREKGHQVWLAHAESALEIIPDTIRFDVIFMSQSIEHVADPVNVLRRLRFLLAPAGVIVLSTPNLDAKEIDWFGPTWAHWHPPYHRHIFSRKGLYSLARQAGYRPLALRTYSHAYWSSLSLAQNGLGLGGSVSHAVNFDADITNRAERANFWHYWIWNRIGRGDYSYLAMRDDADD